MRIGLEQGITAGLAEEHRAFGELAVGDVSRKLVQIFFATTALKKDDGIPPGTRGAAADPPARRRRGGIHGRRDRRAPRWLNVEVDTRLKDADLARVGQGHQGGDRHPGGAAQAPAASPARSSSA